MEDFETPLEEAAPERPVARLRVTPEIRAYWVETANWALAFAGITTLYFIVSSANTLLKAQEPNDFSGMGAGFAIGAIVVGGILTLIPVLFYYRFATLTKKALETEENHLLEEGFGFLKYHYLFYGILTIIYIGLVVLVFVIALVVAGTRGGFN